MLEICFLQTQLARAVAGEIQAHYCAIRPSDLWSKYVGDSEAAVREVFMNAASSARSLPSKCAVIFLDELDSIGLIRGIASNSADSDSCSRRVLAELLMILSELTDQPKEQQDSLSQETFPSLDHQQSSLSCVRFLILAATNRMEDIDPALKRRFAIQLPIYPPSQNDRKRLLQRHLTGISHNINNQEWDDIALLLDGWTGSGLCSLVREACMSPVRECLHQAGSIRQHSTVGLTSNPELDADGCLEQSSMAQDYLLREIQNLRPIIVQDFVHAIQSMQPSADDYHDHQRCSSNNDSHVFKNLRTSYEEMAMDRCLENDDDDL
jgi:SpoVK/Ycf46/Vps4 family AAA+-type ATPase